MLYSHGNTIGNNGFLTKGQIEAANAFQIGDRVRLSEAYRQTLRDCKLYDPKQDEAHGTIVRGGLPNGIFVVGWDVERQGLIHVDHLEKVEKSS